MSTTHEHRDYSTMSGDAAPFPRLRAAYLRAIARAWRDEAFLNELVACSAGHEHSRGALPLLEKNYNFKFPYNVRFTIATTPRPQWRPNEVLGWFGVGDEFHIYLPERPEQPHGSIPGLADALGVYCERFPSLLGAATDGKSQAPDDFANFGVITSRILAMTWAHQEFAKELFASNDARDLVQKSLSIIVPWNFRLRFSPKTWSEFESGRPPYNEITVYIPAPPKEQHDWPIALAAYNDTGPQYPFTCA
ncbi:BMA_0021/BMA_0022 family TOMM bacteriocin [Sorangium sp. So ce385]|uniref:BMA_0021/BMA_0022 family TOMM bacteriocin n=1 Tax=Sorangium sp. So ce385 TaxID=3133308 RepID=UPI003F5C630F